MLCVALCVLIFYKLPYSSYTFQVWYHLLKYKKLHTHTVGINYLPVFSFYTFLKTKSLCSGQVIALDRFTNSV